MPSRRSAGSLGSVHREKSGRSVGSNGRASTPPSNTRLVGNVAQLVVFRPGTDRTGSAAVELLQPDGLEIPLSDKWEFSVIPTRDNRWGEFRWPPSDAIDRTRSAKLSIRGRGISVGH